MANWAAVKKYGASGSPLMLLGTAVTLLLTSMHILSFGWALVLFLLIIVAGMTQHFLYRNRNRVG